MTWLVAAAAAISSGVLLALAFIEPGAGLLASVAFAPLLVVVSRSPRARHAAAAGALAGAVANGISCAWLVGTITRFGGFPLPVALLIYALLIAYTALPLALWTGLLRWAGPRAPILLAPLLWLAIESTFPNLFPWRLAYTQRALPALIQSAEWAGPTLLGGVLIWISAALARAWQEPRGLFLPLGLLGLLGMHGTGRIDDVDRLIRDAPRLRVGLVQGNLTLDEKRHADLFNQNVARYRHLSESFSPAPDLLIWPETVVEWGLPHGAPRLSAGHDPLPGATTPLLFGALTWEPTDQGPRWYNSILLRNPGGDIGGAYDKIVLMPFGEFLPFSETFPWLRDLSPNTGNFAQGTAVEPIPVGANARVGAVVCYEDMLPSLLADATARGANLLASLTNDAWYGDSAALRLHESLALFRAVENRRFLIRSTNTGLTSVIDPVGRITATLVPWQARAQVVEVALLDTPTGYPTYAGPVRILVLVSAAGLLLWCRANVGRTGS